MRALAFAALILLGGTTPGAAAGELDRAAMRTVIEQQIDAFRRDDAAAAFSFATPSLRTMFGSESNFMAMVRSGYPPVYRPKTFAMGAFRDEGGAIEQSVEITDGSGDAWTAIYGFEQQADGRWLISSCRLVKSEQHSA